MKIEECISDLPITVNIFCEKFSWPTESAMRSYILRSKKFGLCDAFLSVGRRVLILPNTFFRLIKEHKRKKPGKYHKKKA